MEKNIKTFKTAKFLLLLFLLSSCDVFLGKDADTSPENILYNLWKDFNEKHAYIDIRMEINPCFDSWEEVYLRYNYYLSRGMDLFYACGMMLQELNDSHVYLFDDKGNYLTTDEYYFPYRKKTSDLYEEVFYIFTAAAEFLEEEENILSNIPLIYGTFKKDPGIGYLYIFGFDDYQIWEEKLDGIIEFFNENTRALIIDIRYNSGGLAPVGEYIASRFTAYQINYAMASAKNGKGYNDFSSPSVFKIKPADNAYIKPVLLLTNKATISAAEWFTLALKTQPHVMHAGTNTSGALSMLTMHPMINGWYYSLSAYKVTDMSGICYEGFGITPDIIITGKEDAEWIVNPATQLDAVLDWFIEKLKR